MKKECIVGHCPGLYEILQIAAYQQTLTEQDDQWPPLPSKYNDEDRVLVMNDILSGMATGEICEEHQHYMIEALATMTDPVLYDLIMSEKLDAINITERGYYLAELRKPSDHQLRHDKPNTQLRLSRW